MNKKIFVLCSLVLVFAFSFLVVANTVLAPSSFSVAEDVSRLYNITVNNTGSGQNITQVNITLPSGFTYVTSTASSSRVTTFSNTSSVLSWTNSTNGAHFVLNQTWQFVWFNATASTPGNYNFTILTMYTGGGTNSSNISITVNDTTAPSNLSFMDPTPASGSNLSQTSIPVNVSVTDNGVVGTIRIYLFNSSRSLVNNTNVTTNAGFVNFTGLANGVYYFNATANDTAGNQNLTGGTYSVTLDTAGPSITFSCTPATVTAGAVVTCSCSGSDLGAGVRTTSFTELPSTSSTGTFSTTCTSTDYASNSNSASFSYIVNSVGGGSFSSGGSSSSSSTTNWKQTHIVNDNQIVEGFVKQISAKERFEFRSSGSIHHVGVLKINKDSAEIEVQSDPVKATLKIGETRLFDLNNNKVNDLSVTLNGVVGSNAMLTLRSLVDKPVENSPQPVENAIVEEETPQLNTSPEVSSSTKSWAIVLIVIVVVVVFFVVWKNRKLKNRKSGKFH